LRSDLTCAMRCATLFGCAGLRSPRSFLVALWSPLPCVHALISPGLSFPYSQHEKSHYFRSYYLRNGRSTLILTNWKRAQLTSGSLSTFAVLAFAAF
jgi:hypothetical protein